MTAYRHVLHCLHGHEPHEPKKQTLSATVRWTRTIRVVIKQQNFQTTVLSREFRCICGKVVKLGSKRNHLRSLKHCLFVMEQTVDDAPAGKA